MNLFDRLKSSSEFAIYGAQVVAYGAYKAILELIQIRPKCFIVSNADGNPIEIEGIPVIEINSVQEDIFIIVAVTELLQGEIISTLMKKNLNKYFILTQHEEFELMSKYFNTLGKFKTMQSYGTANVFPSDFVMYEVKNHRDKPLQNPPALHNFEKTIQAGAALTENRIAELTDNTGINISDKNKQYCEMSATYWVWKNTSHSWCGIEHYRRHLSVTAEMFENGTDAILPLPYICYPNTVTQFRRFASEDVFQAMLKALKELHPQKYDRYIDILYGNYQYTYNMLCAKREVFEAYCSWFFEITEYMEKMENEVSEIKNTRALSYVAEVLTNLYFMSNSDNYCILHTKKFIYV